MSQISILQASYFLLFLSHHYGALVHIPNCWKERIYLSEHATVHALRAWLRNWFGRYNNWRTHEALGNLTPAVVYQTSVKATA